MLRSRRPFALIVGVLLVISGTFVPLSAQASAAATTITFDDITGPSVFFGATATSPTIGDATFQGGVVLTAETNMPADQTSLYGTSSDYDCNGCLPTITISFTQPVNGFSLDVLNGETFEVTYTASDNAGTQQTQTITENFNRGEKRFSLPSSNINSVSISQPDHSHWDFSIDNVTFTPITSQAQRGQALVGSVLGISTGPNGGGIGTTAWEPSLTDYKLPAPGGYQVYAGWGPQSPGSDHFNKSADAWDFVVHPANSTTGNQFPVLASHRGKVIGVRSDSSATGCCENVVNFVLIEEPNDVYADLYLHFAVDTVRVSVGQSIQQGDLLGFAGSTGNSDANHVHFEVHTYKATSVPSGCATVDSSHPGCATGWWYGTNDSTAIPVSFSDVPGGTPQTDQAFISNGKSYRSGNQPPLSWSSATLFNGNLSVSAQPNIPLTVGGQTWFDHVQFTIWWKGFGPESGPWKSVCNLYGNHSSYSCSASLSLLGVPNTPLLPVKISFDTYDTWHNADLSPNGEFQGKITGGFTRFQQ
jgi:murein DD-endopeptidase MepM/ murein hydrolase activator NlpD